MRPYQRLGLFSGSLSCLNKARETTDNITRNQHVDYKKQKLHYSKADISAVSVRVRHLLVVKI